jgi:transposase
MDGLAPDAPVQSPKDRPASRGLGLKDRLDKSLFFRFFNEMVDDRRPTLDANEQVLYIRLFRLSYGFNRNYCTVSQSLLMERTGFSRNTVRTGLQSRVQGGLERANSKRAAVASDMMGASGRAILAALVEGRADPATMAALAKGRLRHKLAALEQAVTGLVRDHHRRLVAIQLAHIDLLEEQSERRSGEIARGLADRRPTEPPAAGGSAGGPAVDERPQTAPLTFPQAVTRLDSMPGVDRRGAGLLVAEWGIEMARFGTAARLAAWTGVAPGKEASAGKQRSGKTRQGHRALRTGLTQMAHAAARTKGTYLSALDQRLAARRGQKRAMMAGAHAIVVSAFHMLSRQECDAELGASDFDDQRRKALVDRLRRRLERLGYRVSLQPSPATA